MMAATQEWQSPQKISLLFDNRCLGTSPPPSNPRSPTRPHKIERPTRKNLHTPQLTSATPSVIEGARPIGLPFAADTSILANCRPASLAAAEVARILRTPQVLCK